MEYNWQLRLNNRKDITIVAFFWAISIFSIISILIVYSIFPAYDLYGAQLGGTFEGGIAKALSVGIKFIIISLVVSILMLGDRFIAWRNAKYQEIDKSKFVEPNLIFKKKKITRLVIAEIIIFFSLPWILAMVGIYISDIPGLNFVFLGRQPYPDSDGYPSVHIGGHHGYDAFVYAMMAIVASISLDSEYFLKNKLIRYLTICGIFFLSFYAFFAGIEDFLNEQIIKRGIDTPVYIFFQVTFNSVFFYPFIVMWSILLTVYLYRRTLRY